MCLALLHGQAFFDITVNGENYLEMLHELKIEIENSQGILISHDKQLLYHIRSAVKKSIIERKCIEKNVGHFEQKLSEENCIYCLIIKKIYSKSSLFFIILMQIRYLTYAAPYILKFLKHSNIRYIYLNSSKNDINMEICI